MRREKKKEKVEGREGRKSGREEKKGFRAREAVVNGKCDEERNGGKKKMCSVNKVTNWVETAIPYPCS